MSYASQDAEAARHICESLRVAAIEVWFDQSELRGGDAWDAKIRKQIKECTLFMPVVSARTQARREGYFRFEWHLADERTHQMAEGTPFVIPVVVDETEERDALVPMSFAAVHWMRFRPGEPDDGLVQRVRHLLEGARLDEAPAVSGQRMPRVRRRGWVRALAVAALLGAGAATLSLWHAKREPVSREAQVQELVSKAWEQRTRITGTGRDAAEAALRHIEAAAAIDPANSSVLAAWSMLDQLYVFNGWDLSAERRRLARMRADRAMNEDPRSFDARLAHASYPVYTRTEASIGGLEVVLAVEKESERVLRELMRERPDDTRVAEALLILLRNTGQTDAALALISRAGARPEEAAAIVEQHGWALLTAGRYREADEAADRAIALQPNSGNLWLKILLALSWSGDLDLAKEMLDRLPQSVFLEPAGASYAVLVYHFRREPQMALRVLGEVPDEWFTSPQFTGPKALLAGQARLQAGLERAARNDFERALQLVDERLKADPANYFLLHQKGMLHAHLGDFDKARATFALSREIGAGLTSLGQLGWMARAAVGDIEESVSDLEQAIEAWPRFWWLAAAHLRLNPDFDPLRGNPRFNALLASVENDPRRSADAVASAVK